MGIRRPSLLVGNGNHPKLIMNIMNKIASTPKNRTSNMSTETLFDTGHFVGHTGNQVLLKDTLVVSTVIKCTGMVLGEAMFGTMACTTTTSGVT
jgi:hypothetical protein